MTEQTTTYSARINENTKTKIMELHTNSGLSTADFFESIVSTYTNNQKTTSKRPEIRAIEKATKEIVVNMELLMSKIETLEEEKTSIANQKNTEIQTIINDLDILEKKHTEENNEYIKKINDIQTKNNIYAEEIKKLNEKIEELESVKKLIKIVEEENKRLKNLLLMEKEIFEEKEKEKEKEEEEEIDTEKMENKKPTFNLI